MAKAKKTAGPDKAAFDAYLSEYEQQQKKEEEARQAALAAFQKAFNVNDTIEVSTVLAQYLNSAKSCGHLALQWTAEKYWALRMPAMMDDLNRIYAELVKQKITEKKKIDFNDGDDHVWYEPSKPYKVVCHTTQNTNFLYVWRKSDAKLTPGCLQVSGRGMRKLDVRRFFDRYDDPFYDRANDKYEKEENEKFKKAVAKEGRTAAIREMWLLEDFADDGVQYPKKLSLDAYRKLKFELDYGDARDPGYILSWDEFGQKVDDAIHHHTMLYHLEECYIPGMIYALFEEE
jgi:hypothetical protein